MRFNEPAQVAEYYQEDLRHKEQEEFHMMLFNTKQNMIGDVTLTKGTVNASLATPREIFIQALRFQAVSLILVHNHPSGEAAITNRINYAELPETGGRGTWIFYVLGAFLTMAGAALLLLQKRCSFCRMTRRRQETESKYDYHK